MQEKQLAKIREAYDLTVQQYRGGLDPLENVPDDFKNSIEYQAFAKESGPSITGSNAPENKEFLNPGTAILTRWQADGMDNNQVNVGILRALITVG